MDYIIVRYGEIGTKSEPVRSNMQQMLRQRVEDRLEYEEIDFEAVSSRQGRIIVEKTGAEAAAGKISELPGVSSTSPAVKVESDLEAMKHAAKDFEIGETFGVRANRAGEHDFSSADVERELGDFIRTEKNAEVDLDDPETWVELDIRYENTYIFTERVQGPGGFPAGSGESVAALVSGGIDSPVAARKIMNCGSNILPIYFYNKPIAAEDHLLRFQSVVRKLEKLNPSKDWFYYVVDLEEANQELLDLGKGRMIVHRQLMFGVAEKIAEKEDLEGIVTGESVSQKSSQTVSNLRKTSEVTDLPIFRPLLTEEKSDITEEARELGTFEDSKIDSACRTMSPESPATKIDYRRLRNLKAAIGFEELVEKAVENAEKKEI